MKKIIIILLAIIIFPTNVLAYENKYFNISLPETFGEVSEDENTYIWESNNESKLPSIIITIENNPVANKQNIEKYSDDDLEDYKSRIKSTFNNELSEYELEVNVKSISKETINNRVILSYEALWPTKESFGYEMYQKAYVFTTENYITSLIYITKNDDKDIDSIKSIIKEFELKDNEVVEKGFFSNKTNQIIVVGAAAGLIGFIISACKKKKTK